MDTGAKTGGVARGSGARSLTRGERETGGDPGSLTRQGGKPAGSQWMALIQWMVGSRRHQVSWRLA